MRTTRLIMVMNFTLWVVMIRVGGTGEIFGFSTETLLKFGASYPPYEQRGEWWRLVTANYLHLHPLHLLMNTGSLAYAGSILEPHILGMRFLVVYLASGVGGSLASLAWYWGEPVVSAGASGAGCGLVAAGAVAMHVAGKREMRNHLLGWMVTILLFGRFVLVNDAAHIGGFVVGAGMMRLVGGGRAHPRAGQKTTGLGLEAFILLAVVAISFSFAGRAWQRNERRLQHDAAVNHAIDLANARKTDEAIAEYRRAIALYPDEWIAHYNLALALLTKGDRKGAIEEAQTARRLDPGNAKPKELIEHIDRAFVEEMLRSDDGDD